MSFPAGAAIAGGAGSARNLVINGTFRINQRGHVSGAALAAGAYAHDRWKAGAGGCTYTFAQAPVDTTVTITSGTLVQVVEDKNVEGGAYALSWAGTAQARIGVNGAAPSGAYAASPITVSGVTPGQQIALEFNAGTLGIVQLEAGASATAFERRSYQDEMDLCLRHKYRRATAAVNEVVIVGQAFSSTLAGAAIPFPVPMRAAPAAAISNMAFANGAGTAIPITGIAAARTSPTGGHVNCTVSSGLTAGNATLFCSSAAGGYIDFDAEI